MRANKYGVSAKDDRTADGIVFHSKREMEAYVGFAILLKSGEISKLELQVPFGLFAAGQGVGDADTHIGRYIADFRVTERDGTVRIYDVKGYSTPEYKLKKKIAEANHGITILEI